MASEVVLTSGVDYELVTRRQYEFNDQRRVKHSVRKGMLFFDMVQNCMLRDCMIAGHCTMMHLLHDNHVDM
jgi:hypothetical protein